jgi:hypothetical protein
MFCKSIQYKMLKVCYLFSSISYIDILFVLVHIEYKVELDHEIPQIFSRLPPLGAIFLSAPPLTWNPGSAPDIIPVLKIIATFDWLNG